MQFHRGEMHARSYTDFPARAAKRTTRSLICFCSYRRPPQLAPRRCSVHDRSSRKRDRENTRIAPVDRSHLESDHNSLQNVDSRFNNYRARQRSR